MASSIGYTGFACPPDDDIDTVPFVERLLVSPSWRQIWQHECPDVPAEAAALADVNWAIRHAPYGREIEGVNEFVCAYERDDAMLSTQQRAA